MLSSQADDHLSVPVRTNGVVAPRASMPSTETHSTSPKPYIFRYRPYAKKTHDTSPKPYIFRHRPYAETNSQPSIATSTQAPKIYIPRHNEDDVISSHNSTARRPRLNNVNPSHNSTSAHNFPIPSSPKSLSANITTPTPTTTSPADDPRLTAASTLRNIVPQLPSSNDKYKTSPLRPLVPADLRVILWRTPHGLAVDDSLSQILSHTTRTKIYQGLLCSVEERTRQSCGEGILRFTQFCDDKNIAEELRMPADPTLLAALIVTHIGTSSPDSIKEWLEGLRLWHVFNRADWAGDDPWVKYLERSATRIAPKTPPLPANSYPSHT